MTKKNGFRTNAGRGLCLVFAFCLAVQTATAPRQAEAQGLVEYALILVLGATVALAIENEPVTRGATRAAERLESALNDAADAQAIGDDALQMKSLKRAIAALKSLRGALSPCRTVNCAELKETVLPVVQTALENQQSLLRYNQTF
jgi:hypothetical protein